MFSCPFRCWIYHTPSDVHCPENVPTFLNLNDSSLRNNFFNFKTCITPLCYFFLCSKSCFQSSLALVELNYSSHLLSLPSFSFSVQYIFSNELNILKAILSGLDNSLFSWFCMKPLILVTISSIISLIPSSESMFSSGSSNVATF